MPDIADIYKREKQRIRRRRMGGLVTAGPVVIPPFATGGNVWAFDPDGGGAGQYIAGPTGTITTPTKVAAVPAYYTFGSTDFIDFGNSLESTWDTTTGFTVYQCFQPTSADIAVANARLSGKYAVATALEWALVLNSGTIDFYVGYTGSYFVNYDVGHSALLSAGNKYVVACTFDITQARGSRTVVYINGTASGVASAQVGASGSPVTATTAPLRIGVASGSAIAPVSTMSYTYAYNTTHDAGTVANISTWLQNTKGWK